MIPTNEEEYIELATKSFSEFFRLYKINHPYKEKEEEIFKKYYEDTYRFSYDLDDGCVSYAKKSWKVLLDTLKNKNINIYYIDWFDKEAFNDEVIRYIEENDIIDKYIQENQILQIPELTILKIKKHRDFIFKLTPSNINDQIISYIRSINFKASEIDDYISTTNLTPPCLLSSRFVLYLLEENIDNIKYYKGDSPSDELIQYLIEHDYIYQSNHNKSLLNSDLMIEEIIRKVNIDIILENDVELNFHTFDALMFAIKIHHHDCKNIKNKYLLSNEIFAFRIAKYLNVPNPYNLEYRYLISNLGRSLEKLSTIFSDNDIQIIIREIIKNDYCINMLGIMDNIDLNKLKEIYDKLYKKESKFNNNFNFYFFIKIMSYFSNNLLLVKELNDYEINDFIIDNLSLVINTNEIVNLSELRNFIEVYKKRISSTDSEYREKIFKLLINKTNDIKKLIDEIINIPQLIYLQLEFPNSSVEYKILESYIEVGNLLKIVLDSDIDDLEFIYSQLIEKIIPNSLFDFKIIRENILRLYSRVYFDMQVNINKLRKSCKYEIINGKEVFDITGEEFILFTHRNNFQLDDDFTGYEMDENKNWQFKNYLCCEFASDLTYQNLNYNDLEFYSLDNPISLIAFGNRDIFIDYIQKPLITANDRFVNPYDMAYFQGKGYAKTEFDFLRIDNYNNKLSDKYIIVKNKEEALKLTESSTDKIILIFDKFEHEKCLINEMNEMIENIGILNYKKIYRLIVLLAKFSCNNYDLSSIQERINMLNEKEQFVLNDALSKYGLIDKIEEKVVKK